MTTVTATPRPRKSKPTAPVSGRCRWLRVLVLNSGKPGRVRIDRPGLASTDYEVFANEQGGRVLGYRLVKDDGTAYDLDAELWACDCPDFVARRDGKDPKGCKH